LRADLLVLDDELAALNAMLAAPADWDGEYGRLLRREIAPFEHDDDSD
jgi:hypothetical protein